MALVQWEVDSTGWRGHPWRGAEDTEVSRRARYEGWCPSPPEPIPASPALEDNPKIGSPWMTINHSGFLSAPVGAVVRHVSLRRGFRDLLRTRLLRSSSWMGTGKPGLTSGPGQKTRATSWGKSPRQASKSIALEVPRTGMTFDLIHPQAPDNH